MASPLGKLFLLRDVPRVTQKMKHRTTVSHSENGTQLFPKHEGQMTVSQSENRSQLIPKHEDQLMTSHVRNDQLPCSCGGAGSGIKEQFHKVSNELRSLRSFVEQLETGDMYTSSVAHYRSRSWKAFALLLDRLFFLLYLGIIIFSLVQFFPAPRYAK